MRRHWFDRFFERNEYSTLPCYEEELNCARKALEEINPDKDCFPPKYTH